MGVTTMAMALSEKPTSALKRSNRPAFTVKRTHEWLLSDVPSDITLEVEGTTFNLHKFPLVSRSGRILRLVKETPREKIELSDMPGGSEAFELAAKFCYGVNLEITASNVAILRCAASYLEMTDHYASGSLETRTEAYLTEIVYHNLPDSVIVLSTCESENILPFAEDLRITTRCIEAITAAACNHQLSAGLSRLHSPTTDTSSANQVWWGKELAVLDVHMFQRVLTSMKARGVGAEMTAGALMHYARGSLDAVTVSVPRARTRGGAGPGLLSPQERKQKAVAETVASLLPPLGTASVPVSFLSWLLRASLALGAASSCISELEKRIAFQLDQASLEDLLIPSLACDGNRGGHGTVFDTDVVLRIVTGFVRHALQQQQDEYVQEGCDDFENSESDGGGESVFDQQTAMISVSKVVDNYLAEVAPDSNLSIVKFVSLAEALPENARTLGDGLYRAIDIFLKAHPSIKEGERARLCKLIDCKKLSHEASAHAAQNDRLPVQLAVQVLYFEQLRLRSAMNGGTIPDMYSNNNNTTYHQNHYYNNNQNPTHHHHAQNHQVPAACYNNGRAGSGAVSAAISPRDNYASVRRENRELKLEVARMRMRLTDLEKDHVSMKQELVKSGSPHAKFFQSFSKKIAKLNFLFKASNSSKEPSRPHPLSSNGHHPFFSRRRRHSIS